jgi:hypothetical protein
VLVFTLLSAFVLDLVSLQGRIDHRPKRMTKIVAFGFTLQLLTFALATDKPASRKVRKCCERVDLGHDISIGPFGLVRLDMSLSRQWLSEPVAD